MMAEWSKATVLRSVLCKRRGFEPHSWYSLIFPPAEIICVDWLLIKKELRSVTLWPSG